MFCVHNIACSSRFLTGCWSTRHSGSTQSNLKHNKLCVIHLFVLVANSQKGSSLFRRLYFYYLYNPQIQKKPSFPSQIRVFLFSKSTIQDYQVLCPPPLSSPEGRMFHVSTLPFFSVHDVNLINIISWYDVQIRYTNPLHRLDHSSANCRDWLKFLKQL